MSGQTPPSSSAPRTAAFPAAGAVPTVVAPPRGRPGLVPLRLTWLLARRGAGNGATLALPVVAFGAVTALLLTVLGGALSFRRWDDELGGMYELLAALALVLLLVPLLTLGGAAARLSARRRDDRLATLRLLGAPPATVAAMTVLESAGLALVGTVAGVLGYLAIGPAVQRIPFRGEAIGDAYWLSPLPVLTTVVAVTVLAALSAAAGLRRVTISPLGVRKRQDRPRISPLRAVVGAAVVGIGVVALSGSYQDVAMAFVVVLGAFAAGLAVLNLLGPWVISVLATVQLRRAVTPARLLAARGIAESPKAVWRGVSSVAMTSFVAVVAGTGVALMDLDEAMTGPERFLPGDIRTGVVITVIASFLMVACSAGVNSAAEVLDRADLYASLHKLGMPEQTMDEARTRTVMLPVVTVALGSAGIASLFVLPLAGLAVILAPLSVAVIVACLVAGILLVRLGVVATRPVLRRALAP